MGINAILAYAPTIFCGAGMRSVSIALFSTLFIGVMNVVTTLISVLIIDRKGRRPLLLWSLWGILLSLILINSAFYFPSLSTGWMVVLGVVLYTFSFGIGMGPIPGLIVSELFPHSIRGPATSFAALCNWIFNFCIIFTFIEVADYLGYTGVFTLYTLIAVVALIFTWKKIPETAGYRLK